MSDYWCEHCNDTTIPYYYTEYNPQCGRCKYPITECGDVIHLLKQRIHDAYEVYAGMEGHNQASSFREAYLNGVIYSMACILKPTGETRKVLTPPNGPDSITKKESKIAVKDVIAKRSYTKGEQE